LGAFAGAGSHYAFREIVVSAYDKKIIEIDLDYRHD
jgi:hypothetical protein